MIGLALTSIFNMTYSSLSSTISVYGYLAIFILIALEAAAFPVPSEVVLPFVGYLGALGKINLVYSFAAAIAGGLLGMTAGYYIAYFLQKDVVYKHLGLFHIKQKSLEEFDLWFNRNGNFTVFVSRLIPAVRALINFPAGFAAMPLKDFYLYSVSGTVIWDILLIAFGYYALSINSAYIVFISIALFAIALYIVYKLAMRKIR